MHFIALTPQNECVPVFILKKHCTFHLHVELKVFEAAVNADRKSGIDIKDYDAFNKAYLNTAGVRAVTVLNGKYKSGQGGDTSTEFRYSWVPDISC